MNPNIKLDYLEGKGLDYKKYKLTKNPFPNVEVTEPNPKILVNREDEVERIFNTTLNSYKTGETDVITVLGKYGSGKSHLLRYFGNKINEQLFGLKEDRGLAVYTTAGENFFQFYRNIVTSFELPFFEKLVNELMLKILEGEEQLLEKYKNNTFSEEEILSIFPIISRKIKIEMPDFLKCFLFIKLDDKKITAWRYLSGDTLNPAERGSLGVSHSLKETDIIRAFSTFKRILSFLNFKTIFILLDELESITSVKNERERDKYYDQLRHFIDYNTAGLCLVIAIHDINYNQIKKQSEPLFRRLLSKIDLEPFEEDSTFEIIKAYLEYNRKEEYLNEINKGKQEKDLITYENILDKISEEFNIPDPEIYPFTKKFTEELRKNTGGLVSEILRYARIAIDFGIKNNKKLLESVDEIPVPSALRSESEGEELKRRYEGR